MVTRWTRAMITPPNDDDITRLAKAVMTVTDLVAEHVGEELDSSESDLGRLQRLIDLRVLGPKDTYELQCLGVGLGRVLVKNVDGLDWAVVDDEYGRDPTIRYRDSSLVFNVLTMI